jgi:hypothetical protein
MMTPDPRPVPGAPAAWRGAAGGLAQPGVSRRHSLVQRSAENEGVFLKYERDSIIIALREESLVRVFSVVVHELLHWAFSMLPAQEDTVHIFDDVLDRLDSEDFPGIHLIHWLFSPLVLLSELLARIEH